MSYQERENIVDIVSSMAILAVFAWYLLGRISGDLALWNDRVFWATMFLVLIIGSIIARIVIIIIFNIVHRIATQEAEPGFLDERDRAIEFRAIRLAHWIFVIGVIAAIGTQAFGLPIAGLFLIVLLAGFASDLVSTVLRIILYRRGI